MGLNEFLGKWGVFLCSVADGLLIVRTNHCHPPIQHHCHSVLFFPIQITAKACVPPYKALPSPGVPPCKSLPREALSVASRQLPYTLTARPHTRWIG